jgi:Cdc6-like AAA superfamily ATPase
MQSSQNAILYSPRKFGKTSLILRAMEETDGEIISLFIDCYAITSEREIFEAITRLFSGLVPKITIKTVPEVQLEVDWEREEDWREACELPERLAEDRGCPVVVVFDEFQELGRFEGLLKTLSSAFQHHTCVSYVFIGSKRHMMEWIFQNRESPFYNFGAHITLREIPEEIFTAFISDAFSRTDSKPAESPPCGREGGTGSLFRRVHSSL